MDNKELKEVVTALTQSVITLTHAAYYGYEMAWGCYELLVEQSDRKTVAARHRKALHGAGKLIYERDELIARLQELLQKLNAL